MIGRFNAPDQAIVVDSLAHDGNLADQRRLLGIAAIAVLHKHGSKSHKTHDGNDQKDDNLHDSIDAKQVRGERHQRADNEPQGDEAQRNNLDKGHRRCDAQPYEGAHTVAPFSLFEYTPSAARRHDAQRTRNRTVAPTRARRGDASGPAAWRPRLRTTSRIHRPEDAMDRKAGP